MDPRISCLDRAQDLFRFCIMEEYYKTLTLLTRIL